MAEEDGSRHEDYYQLAMQEHHQTAAASSSLVNNPTAAGASEIMAPPSFLSSPPLISSGGVTATAKNVTVAHGKTALLTCKVGAGLLDNRTVNQLKSIYMHILIIIFCSNALDPLY